MATFHLPEELVDQIVALHKDASNEQDDASDRRQVLRRQRERLVQLFRLGDVEEREFLRERGRLDSELAGLTETVDQASLYQHAAALLRDLPAAWEMASPEGRNDLARLIYESIEVTDDWVTSVVPQPSFAPFFLINDTGRRHTNGPGDAGAVNAEIDQAEVTGVARTIASRPRLGAGRRNAGTRRMRKAPPGRQDFRLPAAADPRAIAGRLVHGGNVGMHPIHKIRLRATRRGARLSCARNVNRSFLCQPYAKSSGQSTFPSPNGRDHNGRCYGELGATTVT